MRINCGILGIIFLIVFNPIIEYIKQQKASQGYELKTKSCAKYVNTTPFADDFNIISRSSTKHNKLVKDVEKKLSSMGLILKAQKCRSLSIQGGKSKNLTFTLNNSGKPFNIPSVLEKPMKFLGSEVLGNTSPSVIFALMKTKLETKLQNINKSTLRGEHKVKIYVRYALPSMRYYMNVHFIHKTHMEALDSIARKYLKIWLKIQKHGVTDVAIFHPYMLSKQAPSQLYKEAHAATHAMIRTKGDENVNHALDSRIERESTWKKKYSTVCETDKMYIENIESGKISSLTPENETERNNLVQRAKKAMTKSVKEETLHNWNNKVKKLTFQGDFINLLIEEESNITWKSIINNIPKGVLSFAVKACVNGLNTPDNLKRWGIRKFDKCDICGNFSNLEHILNWCNTARDQGRTKWRHDSILNYMAQEMAKGKPSEVNIYTDIPEYSCNGGTLPADIIQTLQRPDIVLLNRKEKKIILFELTVSFEKNIESAHLKKQTRYRDLTSDIKTKGWQVECVPFEIGSRGYISQRNKKSILDTLKKFKVKVPHKKFIQDISKISLLCSFSLFQAHCQPSWQSPPYLHP